MPNQKGIRGVIMTYDKRIDLEEVKEFIAKCGPDTKVYLGSDSERVKIDGAWYADYISVIVVHVDGRHGCKVFGQIIRERDWDQKKNKPRMRLMTECYKICEMYLELSPMIEDTEIEVHLDINPNKMYGSSCVVDEAIGYVKGMCGVTPKVKPEAFCASYCADRYKSFMQ
jgi:predicted RNase H-related nuclease YkuK (DUF458 family)